MDDKKIYKEALDKYGAQMQETICIEELSELQKALCKNIRGKGSMEDISEEIADVQIMCERQRIIEPHAHEFQSHPFSLYAQLKLP